MCRFIEATQPDMNFSLCNGKNSVKVVAPKEGDRWEQGQTYSVASPFPSLEDFAQAGDTLRQFFDFLSTARYERAVSLYGGDYEVLRSWNPTVDPQNFAELWKNGCAINGLQCMEVNNVKVIGMGPDLDNYFQLTVEFYNDDRGIYSEPLSGNTKFTYTVQKGNNGFVVMQMPPYVE